VPSKSVLTPANPALAQSKAWMRVFSTASSD
jgi:hypothetical protein